MKLLRTKECLTLDAHTWTSGWLWVASVIEPFSAPKKADVRALGSGLSESGSVLIEGETLPSHSASTKGVPAYPLQAIDTECVT